MDIPNIESLNCNTCREKYISIHYPDFWEYINKTYPKELKWTEKLYWYYNNIKREIAKKNNLNLIEVFTNDINILIDKIKDLLL